MPSFNRNQLTSFFTSRTQIGLTPVQRRALQGEGLTNVTDFADFKKNEIKMALKNVSQGIQTIPGFPVIPERRNTHGSITQAAVPTVALIQSVSPVIIPVRLASRLYVASIAYHYYTDTSCEINAQNMHYTDVLKDFYIEWEALEQMEKQDALKLPTLPKVEYTSKVV